MLHNTEIFEYSIIFLILFCVIVIIVTTVNVNGCTYLCV